MASLQAHNKRLYFSVLAGSGFLFFTALGPGFGFNTESAFGSWHYEVFEVLCHQDPDRSFTVSGIHMAVCSRCISIYGLFFAGLLGMPLYARFYNSSLKQEKNWLIAAIILNLADVSGNYFGIWTNTMMTRFLLGSLFGMSMAIILTNEFFTLNKSE